MNGEFLSCDWGTSSLRLVLARADDDEPREAVAADEGIGARHRAWQAAGADPGNREAFYLDALAPRIEALSTAAGRSLDGLPLVISGMASASIGLRELPYKPLPFLLDGSDLAVAEVTGLPGVPARRRLMISGARAEEDVMRGEETQLVGAAALEPAVRADGLVILPGTHCKHVAIRAGRAVSLRTYMTGEFFALLTRHSILANSVQEDAGLPAAEAMHHFAAGVQRGAGENLLHSCFGVRVAEISGVRSRAANHHFLSGLVLGTELGELRAGTTDGVTIVAHPALAARYARALEVLAWPGAVRIIPGDRAVIAGQRAIARHAGLLPPR